MYYFVDEETYEVVLKKHQFNTELINGQISPLSSQEECYLIAHIPNTKRGWDVKIIETCSATGGIIKLDELNKNPDIGSPYFKLIPEVKWKDYLSNSDKLTFLDSKKEEESKKVQGVITNVEDVPDIQKRSPAATVSGKPKREGRYQVTLHRDVFGEKPIIKS